MPVSTPCQQGPCKAGADFKVAARSHTCSPPLNPISTLDNNLDNNVFWEETRVFKPVPFLAWDFSA